MIAYFSNLNYCVDDYQGDDGKQNIVHSPLFVRIPFWPITLIITGLFYNPFHYIVKLLLLLLFFVCLLILWRVYTS